jgi:hypothetical protein
VIRDLAETRIQKACTFVSSPMTISSSFPRSTPPYHTLESAPILTLPTTTVAGTTNALSAICGQCPSSAPKKRLLHSS